jgi:hypothetical protein
MNQKTILLLSKIFGVLFILFGVLVGFTSVLGLVASGVAGYGEILASQIGKSVGEFPYAFALIGAVLIMALAVVYFLSAFALLKHKKWAYFAVGAIGAIGLATNGMLVAAGGTFNPIEIIWSMFYLYFAYQIKLHKDIFKN